MNSHTACIAGSTAVILSGSFLCSLCPALFLPVLPVFLLVPALLLIVRYAPIPHPNNPQTPEQLAEHRHRGRVSALKAAAVIIAGYWLLSPDYLGLPLSGAAGLLTAACTLLIPNRREVQTSESH